MLQVVAVDLYASSNTLSDPQLPFGPLSESQLPPTHVPPTSVSRQQEPIAQTKPSTDLEHVHVTHWHRLTVKSA